MNVIEFKSPLFLKEKALRRQKYAHTILLTIDAIIKQSKENNKDLTHLFNLTSVLIMSSKALAEDLLAPVEVTPTPSLKGEIDIGEKTS